MTSELTVDQQLELLRHVADIELALWFIAVGLFYVGAALWRRRA